MSVTARTREEWSAIAIDRGFENVMLKNRIKELEAALDEIREIIRQARYKRWLGDIKKIVERVK